jgi:putative PIN family toxin of toxin-antitoxin system
MLVVLDTNIVVSSLLFRGAASAVHKAWVEGRIELLFSRDMLAEYPQVLSYSKFKLSRDEVEYLMEEEIVPFGHEVEVEDSGTSWIPEDGDDDRFVEAAIQGKADALVSGDDHILSRCKTLPCKVMTLAELLDLLGV